MTVNHDVVGSSPTGGASLEISEDRENLIWLRGQAVKTSPFHGGNTSSILVGVISRCGSIGRAADL